jgi:hypothetical protein
VRLFVSCQALGMTGGDAAIVDDLDGRRRALFEEAKAKIEELRKAAIERARERNGIPRRKRPQPDPSRC